MSLSIDSRYASRLKSKADAVYLSGCRAKVYSLSESKGYFCRKQRKRAVPKTVGSFKRY
jgi:hypothetical protein